MRNILKALVAIAVAAAFIYVQFFLDEQPVVVQEVSPNSTIQDKQ